jgi:aryl-alcohol dehydrogenase-like predicted oxidoreductase
MSAAGPSQGANCAPDWGQSSGGSRKRAGPIISSQANRHRRCFLRVLAAAAATRAWPAVALAQGVTSSPITRAIPATGERVPAIGVGSWLTFDVPPNHPAEAPLFPVLQTFFDRGGTLIDSSPMYGYAEAVIGDLLTETSARGRMFSATKIWTPIKALGRWQFERSCRLWGVSRFDLVQIHNLLQWEAHLETLRELKAAGRVRYIGVTSSEGAKYDEMERALTRERFDFVQFTYNFADRRAERRLLPLAAEQRLAVVINRPFDAGSLFRVVSGKPLPPFAREVDCESWAQYFLKFVVSHPAVTCAIPATSKAAHMAENIGALYGRLPDADLRSRMLKTIESL